MKLADTDNSPGVVTYIANNSGGRWWLTDQNWRDLEAAGWDVDWIANQPAGLFHQEGDERYLGALAVYAKRTGLSLGDAIDEWENVTGACASDLGCNCCGTPHGFSIKRGDGSYGYWSPEYPTRGESYR